MNRRPVIFALKAFAGTVAVGGAFALIRAAYLADLSILPGWAAAIGIVALAMAGVAYDDASRPRR